jgi:hypothetical protein
MLTPSAMPRERNPSSSLPVAASTTEMASPVDVRRNHDFVVSQLLLWISLLLVALYFARENSTQGLQINVCEVNGRAVGGGSG